ncbi:hypothetical protein [Lacinutrix salivirga]
MSIGSLISGSYDDQKNFETGLIGNWKLIEVLVDPEDGSGTFQSIESNKTIEFKVNGIVKING